MRERGSSAASARARSIAATQRRRASVTGPSPTIAATSSTRSAAAEKRCGTRVGGGGVETGHPDAAPSSITGEDGPGVGGGGGRVGGATSAVESACRRVAASFVADNVGNEDGAREFFGSSRSSLAPRPAAIADAAVVAANCGNAKSAKLIPPRGAPRSSSPSRRSIERREEPPRDDGTTDAADPPPPPPPPPPPLALPRPTPPFPPAPHSPCSLRSAAACARASLSFSACIFAAASRLAAADSAVFALAAAAALRSASLLSSASFASFTSRSFLAASSAAFRAAFASGP